MGSKTVAGTKATCSDPSGGDNTTACRRRIEKLLEDEAIESPAQAVHAYSHMMIMCLRKQNGKSDRVTDPPAM